VLGFIVRRVLASIPLLLAASLVLFLLLHVAPGDPETALTGGRPLSQEARQALRERYHLDDSLPSQFGAWVRNVATGDLGESVAERDSVINVIRPRIVPTLQLAAYAFLLILIFGLGLGILAAVRRGRLPDVVASGITLAGSATSPYVSGILLITVFAAVLGLFPVFGLGDGGLDRLYHLTLPAIALAISLTALVARTCRAALATALDQEFVAVARSRGFNELRVVGRHALRNALAPVLTISGLTFGWLISGAVLVEYTFGLGGLGSLLISAVHSRDYAVVQGVALLFAVTFIAINLVIDVLYAIVDPRVRLGERQT
jgi:peptide/nickel transport system permease protein